MRDAAISRVESGLTILADLAGLLIAAEKEDAVVCPGRNSEGHQQINGKRGEPDQSVISEERDNPSGRGQFDANHDQQEHHRDDGAVDQQQHGDDHQKSYNSHLEEGFVATMVHVLHERRRAGHIRGYTFWRGCAVHDTANSIHRFVSQGRTLVTGEIYLNVYAFTVGALRSRRRERIAPKILDVLHVLRIVFQLTNHAVVVPVRIVAEFLLAFQDDHRETVGIRFLEFLAHNLIACTDGASLGLSDTERCFATSSSDGTAVLTKKTIANHARMMGTASRWIVRGTNGGLVCSVLLCSLIMHPSARSR